MQSPHINLVKQPTKQITRVKFKKKKYKNIYIHKYTFFILY